MVERKKRTPEFTIVEGNSGFVWEKVFIAMTNLAKNNHQEVNSQAPQYYFASTEDENDYRLRINASLLNDKENLEIIVADLYCENIHSQQCVVKAVWEKDKPKVIKIDNPIIDNIGKYFYSEEIAMLSERLITTNMNMENQKTGIIINGKTFQIRQNTYLDLVH